MTDLQAIGDEFAEIHKDMESMHQVRESALQQTRHLIQHCAKSIRAMHRQEWDTAKSELSSAGKIHRKTKAELDQYPALKYAGYLQDAEKELVEAAFLLSVLGQGDFPTKSSLDVESKSYLNGAAEAASECRRYVLDRLREGDFEAAERLLSLMESVYDELIQFDFSDNMTGGLRRSTDALRPVIERTRSDLTTTRIQKGLQDALERTREDLSRYNS